MEALQTRTLHPFVVVNGTLVHFTRDAALAEWDGWEHSVVPICKDREMRNATTYDLTNLEADGLRICPTCERKAR